MSTSTAVTAQSPDNSPHIINGVHEAASYHAGSLRTLVDVVQSCFTSGKIRSGDYHFSRSRTMILQHYAHLNIEDQDNIHLAFQKAEDKKVQLEDGKVSMFKRFSLAKDYEQIARHLFVIVETASQRAANKNLKDQFAETIAARATQPPPIGTISTLSNPFTDSHAVSTLTGVDAGNLNEVEVSTYHSEARREAAVVLGLQGRDGTSEQVLAMIPLELVSGGRRGDEETRTVSSYGSVSHGLFDTHSEAGDDTGR